MVSAGLIARKRASDYAGFVFFSALAVWTFVRMPQMGLFLMPTLAHELFVAWAFLVRERPKAVADTISARAAAYAGSFLMIGFFHGIRTWSPGAFMPNEVAGLGTIGALLWLAGSALIVASIWSLRFSFSIEPEARRLVRSGAYEYVRHPVYAAYLMQYVGIWLVFPSPILALAVIIWLAVTMIRMRFEEAVLSRAFPDYERYRQTTGALLPIRLRANMHARTS